LLSNKQSAGQFREACGDGFVIQITYGASLYGILQFADREFESKQKTRIAVDGSGPAGVFSATHAVGQRNVIDGTQPVKKVSR
jgi:hypothetical protein